MQTLNEGIELLYTRDCRNWQQTLLNLKQVLKEEKIKEEPKLVIMDTMEQARMYNFFSSPTVHINGQDVDPQVRRTGKRGLGVDRPYFYEGRSWGFPSKEMIKKAIKDLYFI
ncbi:MAG: DUF2703 domain-containing protein [Patescibacteria group bacterium]